MPEHETLLDLLKDPNHWALEIIIMIVFDGLIGFILYPLFRKKVLHHRTDDQKIEELEQQVAELYRLIKKG